MSEDLLLNALDGDQNALGTLLEKCRPYLGILAKSQLDTRVQGKSSFEDLIQDAFLEAHRDFGNFRGTSIREFLGWLRAILSNRILKLYRHYLGTKSRDVRLERNVEQDLDRSSKRLSVALLAAEDSPSQIAVQNENAVLVAQAIDELPSIQREIVLLRQIQGLEFRDIASRLDESVGAVRSLWARALVKMRSRLKEYE